MGPKWFRHKGASARLVQLDPYIYALGNLYSKNRNCGEATDVMKQIIKFADEREATLTLVVQRYGYTDDKSPDNKGLIEFYKRFDFVVEPSEKVWPIAMSRQPSQEKHAL